MGIRLISSHKGILYDTSEASSSRPNGFEYQIFMDILALIKNQASTHGLTIFGNADKKYLERRFCGETTDKKLPAILPEQQGNMFPDIVIVGEDIVVCMEHFRIDASKSTSKGSKYNQFIAKHKMEMLRGNKEELEALLVTEEIQFETENLKKSLHEKLVGKAKKTETYFEAVRTHFSCGPNSDVNKEDLSKDFEMWFLIEDNTPTTDFPFFDSRISSLLSCLQQVAGIIYYHDPNPYQHTDSLGDVAVIRNDDEAHRRFLGK